MRAMRIKAKKLGLIRFSLVAAIIFSLTALFPNSSSAQTYVKGPVNGHWYSNGNPYITEGNIWVELGDTLYLHNGVILQFTDEDSMIVYGTLLIYPPYSPRVTFQQRPGSSKHWQGITFKYFNSSGSVLHYAIIKDAVCCITCFGSNPRIEYNYIEPINYGIKAISANPTIIGDTIRVDSVNTETDLAYGISLNSGTNWLTIKDCVIDIFVDSPLIDVSAIGISSVDCDVALINNRIRVGSKGKPIGIYLQNTQKDTIIHNEIFAYSYCAYARAGLMEINCDGSEIFNNTVEVNSPNKDYGLIFDNCDDIIVMNNIDVGDNLSVGITGILSSISVFFNDFYGHSTIAEGCQVDPVTNIFLDPAFTGILPDSIYFLTSTSPCIDRGNPDPLFNDPDGTRNDIGAHYYNQYVGCDPGVNSPAGWEIFALFPNPTNNSATISLELEHSGYIRIESYDILGRRVASIIDGYLDPGDHRFKVDLTGQSSGIYYFILSTPEYRHIRKLSLIK